VVQREKNREEGKNTIDDDFKRDVASLPLALKGSSHRKILPVVNQRVTTRGKIERKKASSPLV